jgi:uncharacterized protein with GYD domain
MPKYLITASLTQDGLQGTLNEGSITRREAIRRAAESIGGNLEALYYAFGDRDVYIIVELPDNVTGAAAGMIVSAAGDWSSTTFVLVTTPEQMDELSNENVQAHTPPWA